MLVCHNLILQSYEEKSKQQKMPIKKYHKKIIEQHTAQLNIA